MGTTAFPAALDTFPAIGPSTQENATGVEHDVVHENVHASVFALEGKVGVDGSLVVTSLEYRVSAAAAAAATAYSVAAAALPASAAGAAGGVATLDGSGKVPSTQLPASTGGSWGGITGTLSAQTDLQSALDAKLDDTQIDTDASLTANSDSHLASQKAVKSFILAQLDGRSWKQSVRAASVANGVLATAYANGSVLDGVTLATGDRILLKDQTTASENGIYIVAASGAPTRSTDADSGAELVNATVEVSEGTANADLQFTCSTNAPITVGTTALVFVQASSSTGSYTADEVTLHLAGTQFSVATGGIGSSQLAAQAVTLPKLVNASATARVLLRKTAGAGSYEEGTLSDLLDFIGSAATGDILYRGASGWVRLPKTTDGDYLTQVSGLPAWVTLTGGAVSSITLSGSAATYSALPSGLGTGGAGKSYLVLADGLIYVWSGTAFPASGAGLRVGDSPYAGKYNPDRPPTGIFAGEDFKGDAEALTWAWGTQGSATMDYQCDTAFIVADAASALRTRFTACPSGIDFIVAAKMNLATAASTARAGICILSAGTTAAPTELWTVGLIDGGSFNKTTRVEKFTSTTTSTGGVTGSGTVSHYFASAWVYLRARYIASTKSLGLDISMDGIRWSQLQSATLTNHPISVGYFVWPGGSASTSVTCNWFRIRTDVGTGFRSAVVGA